MCGTGELWSGKKKKKKKAAYRGSMVQWVRKPERPGFKLLLCFYLPM